ncbi:bumetanide-sensitive sodium-(potassium)-chloride cotransporter-like isoform X2 [Neocloeon triangulifer]|uniref:bumetanide-sensitive sodium-(potassium)-chloride cotransporter-like isoform X2 n=1 Tax=Neocloeon triangulifer TaxID=2078957 RepID=UPI00286F6652|nr:bumetanide-sensitive sodium-(potassium)-chloride cotransporter-like isoform X2 [Neocloeon triangulifer]
MTERFEVRGTNPPPPPLVMQETSFANGNANTVTPRKRSLAQMTRDVLPRIDNYRNLMSVAAVQRPTFGELYEGVEEEKTDQPASGHEAQGHVKLGWIQGVFLSVALNIWGVMLFLRVSWVVGHAGIGLALVIIAFSAFVCTVTTLSLSAISTNGVIKGGGIYYIISRSLGPEFGASVGLVFAFANTVSASMNTIGFCDSLNSLLKQQGYKIIDNSVNDSRIIGSATVVILIVICAVGMDYEVIAQDVFGVVIVGAIVDYCVGVFMGPQNEVAYAQGFVGLNVSVYAENIGPGFRFSEGVNQNFFTVFSIFFTSVTGVQAGANISGDLKDPEGAIPKGTLLAILMTMLSYVLFVLLVGGGQLRETSGIVEEVANGTFTDCTYRKCSYGLYNDYSVMQLMSAWGPFIYAGCFAATLSTAMTNLLSVPRIIQALGNDGIYPGISWFGKPYGLHGEPYRAYVLTALVSIAFVLIADLNAIANLVSNFYLAAYAFINFCTFHAAFVKPLGWRPTFTYYNKWLSLIMTFICIILMILIDWIMALITVGVIALLYFFVVYRKPDVNWGASTQAQTYNTTLSAVQSLNNIEDHVKNYRPQILVLAGHPTSRPALLDFANLITKRLSLLICGCVSPQPLSHRERQSAVNSAIQFFKERKMRAFFSLVDSLSVEMGTRALLQASGIGRMKPNILLMGYKAEWQVSTPEDVVEYFDILHDAFTNRVSIAIVRLKTGLDNGQSVIGSKGSYQAFPRVDSEGCFINEGFSESEIPESPALHRYNLSTHLTPENPVGKGKKSPAASYINMGMEEGPTVSTTAMETDSIFLRKQKKGTIDIWWLYDDGGLTLLLPYIISTRKKWAGSKLRIFTLIDKKDEMQIEERNMASLLSKFRIDYANLTMVHDVSEKPHPKTARLFEDIIKPFREDNSPTSSKDNKFFISDSELKLLVNKTERQLRLRELLQQHSRDSNMIVMTMPMPRKGVVSAPLYMAWLEVLTRDMPPFMLVRGNQTSVLSFYA